MSEEPLSTFLHIHAFSHDDVIIIMTDAHKKSLIYFFIFSLKKIGYILKIHNFAPSRIRLVYEYF